MIKKSRKIFYALAAVLVCSVAMPHIVHAQPQAPEMVETEETGRMQDYPVVKLQSLDKATARTMTFEAKVGTTVKFGPLYIKVQACRKSSPLQQPESASFLQIWEVTEDEEAQWVFSGWMFASSPALSPMDHPIYDVWVIDCLESTNSDTDESADDEPESETETQEPPDTDPAKAAE